jgi:hypothetical protein
VNQRTVDDERRRERDEERGTERDPEERIAEPGIHRTRPDQDDRAVDDLHRHDRKGVSGERGADCRAEADPAAEKRPDRQRIAEEESEHDREQN